jgi:hypothetical protein
MTKILLVAALTMFSFAASASDDQSEIQNCLAHWGHTPFTGRPPFRVISSSVRVMGIGSEITDSANTDKPELILIRPAVSVMAKTTMNLDNPNGWYCLKGKVDVLGKTTINLNCKAHLASSNEAVTVGGSNKEETGVTVLGKSTVNKVCK